MLEDLELAVGGLDVVVNDDGVRQLQRFLLVRLAAEDVVARELVLRALQLVLGDRLGLQLVELGDERRRSASSGVCPGWTIATA